MTHLNRRRRDQISLEKSVSFLYPMAIIWRNVSSTRRRRKPVPWTELFRLFSMKTINWYVRLARRVPPSRINDDFNDWRTPAYVHGNDPFTSNKSSQVENKYLSLFYLFYCSDTKDYADQRENRPAESASLEYWGNSNNHKYDRSIDNSTPKHWIDFDRDRTNKDRDSTEDLSQLHSWSSMFPKEQDSPWYPTGWFSQRPISLFADLMTERSTPSVSFHKYRKQGFETECTIHRSSWRSLLDQSDKYSDSSMPNNCKSPIGTEGKVMCCSSVRRSMWNRNLDCVEIESERKDSIDWELKSTLAENMLKDGTFFMYLRWDLHWFSNNVWVVMNSVDEVCCAKEQIVFFFVRRWLFSSDLSGFV